MRIQELQFLDLVVFHQKLGRSFTGEEDLELDLGGIRVLWAIEENPESRLIDLERILWIPKTTLTRELKKLREDGYIKIVQRRISLSSKGEEFLVGYNRNLNRMFEESAQTLSDAELARLEELLGTLADGFGVPRSAKPNRSIPIRESSLRLGRAIGTYGNRTLHEPGLTMTIWIMLTDLRSSVDGVTASELCKTLNCRPNTMSHSVQKLLRRKLITRRRNERDKREWLLSLTESGREYVDELESKYAERHSFAWRDISVENRSEMLQLLRRYFQVPADESEHVLQPKISVAQVRDQKRLSELRRFALERFYLKSHDHLIPEKLFPEDSNVYEMRVENATGAVLEVGHDEEGTYIKHFIYSPKNSPKSALREFLTIATHNREGDEKLRGVSAISAMDSENVISEFSELKH